MQIRQKPGYGANPRVLILIVLAVLAAIGCGNLLYHEIFSVPYMSAKEYNNRIAPRHGKMLCAALNKYYEKYRAYPAYLLGGSNKWRKFHEVHADSPSPDPLLREGIIRRYPKNDLLGRIVPSGFDPRFDRYSKYTIHNLVSTPNDIVVRHYITVMSEWIKYYEERSTEDRYRENLEKAVGLLESGGRMQTAGGIRNRENVSEEKVGYSITPEELGNLLVHDARFCPAPHILQGNFGYARGEHIKGDQTSAFLWMYGKLRDQEHHFGLDVLNAETGELVPDGIPDGICILYELRDGEVVNVTLAEDM
ncbi:hypothetical protein J7J84_07720 [bacterium]|nr:hypothetical protein [bacterium]